MQRTLVIIMLMTLFLCGCSQKKKVTTEKQAPQLLHPSFSLTSGDLSEMTEGLPEKIAADIKARPKDFLELILKLMDEDPGLTRLVNKQTGLGPDEVPKDLVDLDVYKDRLTLSRKGLRLRQILIPSLLDMTEAAARQGISLMISSTYRSYDYQEKLYNRYAAKDGQEAADRYSAHPGKSQHQLGTVIDFGSIDDSFADTKAGKWLKENAWKYGFSLSYPKDLESFTGYVWESWHYRYIGKDAALLEREFFGGIQERMLRFLHEKSGLLKAALIHH